MLKLFGLFDTKAESYGKPFVAVTTAVALRELEVIVNDPGNQVSAHPEDFCLFEFGEFHQHDGTFNLHTTPISLGLAMHLKHPDTALPPLTAFEPGEHPDLINGSDTEVNDAPR